MRKSVFALALVASLLLPTIASAVVPPPNVLFAGTIQRRFLTNGSSSWCLFEGANSTYLRRGALTLISFPDIIVAPTGSVGPAYTMGGQAGLTFNAGSNTNGRIEFIPVPGNGITNRPSFSHYEADYDAATRTVTVSFRMRFGTTCALTVFGTYRN